MEKKPTDLSGIILERRLLWSLSWATVDVESCSWSLPIASRQDTQTVRLSSVPLNFRPWRPQLHACTAVIVSGETFVVILRVNRNRERK